MEAKSIKLNNIKSRYILKNIFSYLDEGLELEIIIYSKQLQKQLNVNIDNYKNMTGHYTKIEKNGKGKEYTINGDIMIFEGEYKNKKRNGKGTEYYINGDL